MCNYKMHEQTPHNWRASVASETLTGVTQSKIGDVCLFIYLYTSDVLEHKWRASLKTILFLYD